MSGHKQFNLILALILLPVAIIIPTQSVTLTATNPAPPETSLPETLQGIPGATADWWVAVQQDLHLPGYHTTQPMAGISGLSLVPNWGDEGDQEGAQFGFSVGTAGDVNGDGYDDVIVGAPFYANGQSTEGAAAVYYGSASGLSLNPNWMDESDQDNANFGVSVGTAGDVNGDGYGDIIVGAPYLGSSEGGVALVYHGSASGLSPIPNWSGESDQGFSAFGQSVASAGDINNDGYDDVIIGAPYYGGLEKGAVAVYYGSLFGLSLTIDWGYENSIPFADFGKSAASAGDVNGDGFDDVIIGAPLYMNGEEAEGAAVVFYGSGSGLSLVPNWMVESNQYSTQFGYSVNTAGDVNGDGYEDVVVGAPSYDHGQANEGGAAVYYGSLSGLSLLPNWIAEGDQEGAYFGNSVGKAGDVNSDGYADVVIGAPFLSRGQTEEGAAFVYIGSTTGLSPVSTWIDEGDQENAEFGWSVSTAGDVNGDGKDDIIVGAPNYDHGQLDEGAAAVYHGGEPLHYLYLPVILHNP